MKNTTTLAKRSALIAVLVLGGSTWLNAQQSSQGQSGQTAGQNHQGTYGASGTNSQYNQGQSGQTAGQNRQGTYGASGTNSQYNQGQSGQTGNRQGSYGAYGTNSQYNQGQSGQTTGQNRQGSYGAYGTNSQYNQGQSGQTAGQNRQGSYGAYGTNSQYNQGQSGQAQGGLGQQGSYGSESQSLQVTKMNKGSAIIGTAVKNQQGEALGKIRDLVIDFKSGQVAYLVLDSETGLFNAAKLHAVPLRAFQPDAEGTTLVLDTDKTQLDSSEGFTKDNWPGAAAATWGAEPGSKSKQGTYKSGETYDNDRQNTNDLKNKSYEDSTTESKSSKSQP